MAGECCPRTTLLANGEYAVMLTDAGSGYSRWRNLAVTRWREDPTCDAWGSYFYVRDIRTGETWAATEQPLATGGGGREAHLLEHAAAYACRDRNLTSTLEIALHGRDAVELRGLGLRNDGDTARELEITSYAELVLGDANGDAAHPAFSKMFVQTERQGDVLLATRRKRDPAEPDIWAAHAVVVDGGVVGPVQCETDRVRFVGRDRSARSPQALDGDAPLSGTVGTVLDPIFALRVRVSVAPGTTRRIAFLTAAAPTRSDALRLIKRNATVGACAKIFVNAQSEYAAALRRLGIDDQEARGFRRLADALLYSNPALRAPADVLAQGEGGAPVLWAKGISSDLPIALLCGNAPSLLSSLESLLHAQAWWRQKHLSVDLVVINDATGKIADSLQQRLESLVAQATGDQLPDKTKGSVFVLRGDQVDARLRNGLMTVARIVMDGKKGDFTAQLARANPSAPMLADTSARTRSHEAESPRPGRDSRSRPEDSEALASIEDFNGLGGFSADGREYVTVLRHGQSTPMPWSQIVANPDFGFLSTTTGGGYSWALNSQQNPLTPWSNDPVGDPPGEVLYLRDADSGALWSATAAPIRVADSIYVARFGAGYAKYECTAHGIESELLQFVPLTDSLKISRLRLRNNGAGHRRLEITAYVRWALGAIGTNPEPFTVTSFNAPSGSLLARNRWREEFADRVAFAAFDSEPEGYCGDRGEFLGRHGALEAPSALTGARMLSGKVGAGLDPCGALQTTIDLAPHAEVELVFLLGEAADERQALELVRHYRKVDLDAEFASVEQQWDETLGTVQVHTPDRSMDRLLNRYLLYQTLVCRLWARTAFYQASGAYGFRDQLQDVMALCVARPELAREHILRSAARQFTEGDVQHWWLPPNGRGIRSRVTDDRLWLPYVVAHYLQTTGDAQVLDEAMPFLQGPVLKPGQNDAFFTPQISKEAGTLFEHCARAIEVSMCNGVHGLPLMGTGDWNDGMNRVGIKGKGESVWLGWFLYAVLENFAPIAQQRGEAQRAKSWRFHAAALRIALEDAWDGQWYLRAYYDDGTPLGSHDDTECMIDSMAQTWGVMSGAADPEHAVRAMRAVEKHLVREADGLVALFTAPFDRTRHDPGYIKGYPPGLRENGGQYTHGSIWAAIAFAMLGEGDKAHELFDIFNPLGHTHTPESVELYKVEPYVVCADIYSLTPHIGRGGWSWYSGSAGWLYRAGLESLLGFQLRGDKLRIDPCIPKEWTGFELEYHRGSSLYTVAVENPDGVCRGVTRMEMDGSVLKDTDAMISLVDDGRPHHIRILLGRQARARKPRGVAGNPQHNPEDD